jgi:hypothetical protein
MPTRFEGKSVFEDVSLAQPNALGAGPSRAGDSPPSRSPSPRSPGPSIAATTWGSRRSRASSDRATMSRSSRRSCSSESKRCLHEHNVSGERHSGHAHYLRGSVFCARCGSRLILTLAKGHANGNSVRPALRKLWHSTSSRPSRTASGGSWPWPSRPWRRTARTTSRSWRHWIWWRSCWSQERAGTPKLTTRGGGGSTSTTSTSCWWTSARSEALPTPHLSAPLWSSSWPGTTNARLQCGSRAIRGLNVSHLVLPVGFEPTLSVV